MDFPILYGLDKNSNKKQWTIKVTENEQKHGIIEVSAGRLGGQQTTHTTVIETGKNIGKKNETTPLQQAINQAQKKWNDKIEREKYSQNQDVKSFVISPMLAKEYKMDKAKKMDIVFPCHIQPKIDGWRCLAHFENGVVSLKTRSGREYYHLDKLRGILKEFLKNNENIILDGEIYINDIPFETFSGLCNKQKCTKEELEQKDKLQLWVYDMIDTTNKSMPFTERNKKIKEYIKNINSPLVIEVKTEKINKKDEIMDKHNEYVTNGFEGLMLRNSASPYQVKARTSDLQKVKIFTEEEFKIVGFDQGIGDELGCILWKLEYLNHKGKAETFSVRPKGTRESRQELYQECINDFDKYKNKLFTVKFFEKMKNNCPRFPVGKCIRWELNK